MYVNLFIVNHSYREGYIFKARSIHVVVIIKLMREDRKRLYMGRGC